jgi:membrane fusion protein, copper/silver efflux system
MNNMKKLITILFFIGFAFVDFSCTSKTEVNAESEVVQTYTCPMHPQIVQNKPGTCPICGMDLVPFDKTNTEAYLILGEAQRLLANVVTDTVRTGSFSTQKQLNGRIAINPEQIEMISSRVAGRIENLSIRETGVFVNRGQHIYSIYSEQLSAMQQEYLVAVAQAEQFPADAKFQQIKEAAKQRLLLLDQTEAQIRSLVNSRKISPYISYTSPVSGVVSELYTSQGQYVAEGSPVLRIENYQTVWVEADVYPSEISGIKVGQVVTIRVAGYENERQSMRIEFISPALQAGSQLLTIRGKISNPNNRYRAGMQVFVDVPVSNISDAFTLPVDAVIRDGNGYHIWIETEPGRFEPRSVKTGTENFNRVEITEGLESGEIVVISGAYLLYSEFVLKKGSSPTGEHNH